LQGEVRPGSADYSTAGPALGRFKEQGVDLLEGLIQKSFGKIGFGPKASAGAVQSTKPNRPGPPARVDSRLPPSKRRPER